MAATARRRDGHLARERMLEEAMTAIAEDGLAALTMSALAKRLGTSGGHILYYFGSKDRLLLEVLGWSESALTEERRALLAGRAGAERKLALFLELYLPAGRAIRAGRCGSSCGRARRRTSRCDRPRPRSTAAGRRTSNHSWPRACDRAASPRASTPRRAPPNSSPCSTG